MRVTPVYIVVSRALVILIMYLVKPHMLRVILVTCVLKRGAKLPPGVSHLLD